MDLPTAQPLEQTYSQSFLLAQKIIGIEKQIRNGADTFFWIAALSVVNTIVYLTGGTATFVIGLGATLMIDIFTKKLAEDMSANGGLVIHVIGIGLDVVIMGMFVLFGVLGRKKHKTAVLFGMALYVLDALIYVYFQEWMSVFFHVWMLVTLWSGVKAMGKLKDLETSASPGDLAAARLLINPAQSRLKTLK